MAGTEAIDLAAAEAVSRADEHPFVARVRAYADDALRPTGLRTDRESVTRERVSELARLGLLNHLAPAELGGAGLDRAADRRLHELVAGGCFNTWLVWAQHAPLVGRLASAVAEGGPVSALARQVLRGEVLVGAAISDIRRFPRGHLSAGRTARGWVLDGVASWVSGWGLHAALAVAAVDESTRTVVTALVPVQPAMRASPLDLAAVRGSRTSRVQLHDLVVDEEQVIGTEALDDWRHKDLGVASDARPHHFGLAGTVLDELEHADSPQAREVARRWRPRVAAIRASAYHLADAAAEHGGEHRLAERLAVKVASGEALAALTRALVVARAGRGLSTDDTAQLHASSALFVLVQGQNADVRRAQLGHLAGEGDRPAASRPPDQRHVP